MTIGRMLIACGISKATRTPHAHTHTEICNTYCFSTAVVSQSHLSITLHVRTLPVLFSLTGSGVISGLYNRFSRILGNA